MALEIIKEILKFPYSSLKHVNPFEFKIMKFEAISRF